MPDYFPPNGKDRSQKKAIIIITIITVVLLLIWLAFLIVMHHNEEWLFKPYSRPPLPDQKGDATVLSDSQGNFPTDPGSVMHFGTVRPYTEDEKAAIKAQVSSEKKDWERIKSQENQKPANVVGLSLSSSLTNTDVYEIHPEILRLLKV